MNKKPAPIMCPFHSSDVPSMYSGSRKALPHVVLGIKQRHLSSSLVWISGSWDARRSKWPTGRHPETHLQGSSTRGEPLLLQRQPLRFQDRPEIRVHREQHTRAGRRTRVDVCRVHPFERSVRHQVSQRGLGFHSGVVATGRLIRWRGGRGSVQRGWVDCWSRVHHRPQLWSVRLWRWLAKVQGNLQVNCLPWVEISWFGSCFFFFHTSPRSS